MTTTHNAATRHRNRQKQKAVEFFGGKCQSCGYNKSLSALTFHHLDPSKKEWSPSRVMSYKWETVIKELEKCILLCHNCHQELHEGVTEFPVQNFIKNTISVKCKACYIEFMTKDYNRIYCGPFCSALKHRKVDRPTKSELQRLITSKISWKELGRRFNVSDNAVRKWARKYELI